MASSKLGDVSRRWTAAISQLRTRAAKSSGRSKAQDEIVDASLALCEALLTDLAAAQLRATASERRANAAATNRDYLLQRLPVACVETDADAIILMANPLAASLLNMSSKYLEHRLLLHFVEDRAAFSQLLQSLSGDHASAQRARLALRPRERAAVLIDATIVPAAAVDAATWWWFIAPAADRSIRHAESGPVEIAG